MKVQLLEKHALVQDMRYKNMQKRLRDNLERNLAYRMVVDEHNFSHASDYQKALGANYTYDALKPEINKMMARLKPSYLREQKAKLQLQQSRDEQKNIIERNLEHPSLQTSSAREKRERERRKGGGGGYNDVRMGRYRAEEIPIASTGGFLLNRYANAFSGNIPQPDKDQSRKINPDEDDNEQQRLFQKVSRMRRESLHSPTPSKFQKLKPLTDSRSMKSMKSVMSGTNSLKTMSLGRGRLKKVKHVTMSEPEEEEDEDQGSPRALNQNIKTDRKQKKRYTLPPVRVQKHHVKSRPLL